MSTNRVNNIAILLRPEMKRSVTGSDGSMLTGEHVARHIAANLQRAEINSSHHDSNEETGTSALGPVVTSQTFVAPPITLPIVDGPTHSFVDKVIRRVTDAYLPRVNLTSYNSLRRARTLVRLVEAELLKTTAEKSRLENVTGQLALQQDALRSELGQVAEAKEILADKVSALAAELHVAQANANDKAQCLRMSADGLAKAEEALETARLAASAKDIELARAGHELETFREGWRQAISQSDQLTVAMAQLTGDRDRVVAELLRVSASRDSLAAETAALRLSLERQTSDVLQLVADRDRLATELGHVVSERERLKIELTRTAAQRDQVQDDADHYGGKVTQILAGFQHLRVVAERASRSPNSRPHTLDPIKRIAEINRRLCNPDIVRRVRDTLHTHYESDSVKDLNLTHLFSVYDQALADGLPYWDVRIAARVITSIIKPETYLEIGTRRGWSLAQVLSEKPDTHAYVFEMWQGNYGSCQGSPEYVLDKMRAVVGPDHKPHVDFVDGNSHDTLPRFFAGQILEHPDAPPQEFDLITVDGDHTRVGAWWDLQDIFERVRAGGAVLFDDLEYLGDEAIGGSSDSRFSRPELPGHVSSLMDVWLHMQALYPNFVFFTPIRLQYRAGLAYRFQ